MNLAAVALLLAPSTFLPGDASAVANTAGGVAFVTGSAGLAAPSGAASTPKPASTAMPPPPPTPIDVGVMEMIVIPGSFSLGQDGPSKQTLSREEIANSSWAEDVTRAVTRLPGISSSDYSSNFAIRGGEADETLITLDGVDLYDPYHQRDYSGGLFSIVDIETVDRIELNTGGFSAAHGNRLSGVLDLHTRKSADGKPHASLGVSFVNARAYGEGTFAGEKGFYMASARRGMLDQTFRLVRMTENLPTFYDAMAKIEYSVAPGQTVSLHALHSGDHMRVRDISEDNFDKNDTFYQNDYGWLTLDSIWGPAVLSRTVLYSTLISHDRRGAFHKYEPSDKGDFSLSDRRRFLAGGVKQDWTWQPSDAYVLQAGADVRQLQTEYDYSVYLNEIRPDPAENLYTYERDSRIRERPAGQQVGLYLTNRFALTEKLFAEPGLRFDYAGYTGDRMWSPRAALAYAVSNRTFVRAAWGYYWQPQLIYGLDVSHDNTQFDPAKLAEHYVVGFEHSFELGLHARLEGYYKEYSHLPPLWTNLRDQLEVFPEQRNDNVRLVRSGGNARGAEILLKYDHGGPVSGRVSYALARAVDDIRSIEFDGVMAGGRSGTAPRLNDQRHTIYADLDFRPNARWYVNLSWQFWRGWPRTGYTYRIQTLPGGDLHFYPAHSAYNGEVYPDYHRLDLRINRHFRTRYGTISGFVHLINLYNRKNLKKFDLDTENDAGEPSMDAGGNYIPVRDDTYWLGLLPAAGVSWEM